MKLLFNHSSGVGMRRRTLSQEIEVGAVTLTFAVFTLAVVVSLIHLAHANRTATRGYILEKIELQKEALATEMEILRQKTSEAKSLMTIQNSETVQKMVPIKNPVYLEWPS